MMYLVAPDYQQIFDNRGVLYNAAHLVCPAARQSEGEALLRWLNPQPGETILVAAAGGGFDAASIYQATDGTARVICVEPSRSFSKMIPDTLEVLNAPIDRIPLADDSVDAIVNLATLHHVIEREATFREWNRILKPGGRIVIGDVEDSSPNGAFLNTTVDRYTPGGHQGVFLQPGELTAHFDRLGYAECREELESYAWRFESTERMTLFCLLLFGMVKGTTAEIAREIDLYLGIEHTDNSVSFPWSLRFFQGIKAVVA